MELDPRAHLRVLLRHPLFQLRLLARLSRGDGGARVLQFRGQRLRVPPAASRHGQPVLALAVLRGEARVRGGLLLRAALRRFLPRSLHGGGERLHVFAANGSALPAPALALVIDGRVVKGLGWARAGGGRRVRDAPMRGTGGSGRAARGDPSGGRKTKIRTVGGGAGVGFRGIRGISRGTIAPRDAP